MPELKTAKSLESIIGVIVANKEPMSRTKIRNTLNLSEGDLTEALSLGCSEGVLEKFEYNFYGNVGKFKIPESYYYPAVRSALVELWLNKFNDGEFYIEETARKDSKIVGRWTRPDFTIVSHKKFAWTIGYEFDVVTFEVKRPDSCDVLAVFEALSHATAATRAYVVFPVNATQWAESHPEQEARVKDECSRHGVGLILIEDIYSKPRPVQVIAAQKREIDHDKCSNFLGNVLSDEGLRKISIWK